VGKIGGASRFSGGRGVVVRRLGGAVAAAAMVRSAERM